MNTRKKRCGFSGFCSRLIRCFCCQTEMREFGEEWFLKAPWGKIAMVSWGNPKGPPVLLVHGRQDSVASFIPLINHLSKEYNYVGFDLPGHGNSDPFPISTMLMRIHFVSAIEVVVSNLKWRRFAYIGHSIGCELGLFYNAVHPTQITKFVHLDGAPALQSNQMRPIRHYYEQFFAQYYSRYQEINTDDRVYSKERALLSVMRARGLNEQQAEMVLSRNLTRVGEDEYKVSWDKRLKFPAPINLDSKYMLRLFRANAPPTLFIRATNTNSTYPPGKADNDRLIEEMAKSIKHFNYLLVEGSHDLHLVSPEDISDEINTFLDKDFDLLAKL